MNINMILSVVMVVSSYFSCSGSKTVAPETEERVLEEIVVQPKKDLDTLHRAYFASGCFWCVEAIFESVIGVEEVISGYSGGRAVNANYKAVSAGWTNHAEAVEVYYDSTMIDYPTLLQVFFGSHDPTTLNQQGPDRGPQYRSAIFYLNNKEKSIAESYKSQLQESGIFSKNIVTEVVPFEAFYDAEDYHQDFERRNPNQGYVKAVSIPRLNKFKKKFPDLLKPSAQLH